VLEEEIRKDQDCSASSPEEGPSRRFAAYIVVVLDTAEDEPFRFRESFSVLSVHRAPGEVLPFPFILF
jgi:hypothetical protein